MIRPVKKETTAGARARRRKGASVPARYFRRGSGRELSSLAAFRRFPQCNADVVTEHKFSIAADAELALFADAVRGMLGEDGRIMLRGSGTEPKLRIMAESDDGALCDEVCSLVARAVAGEGVCAE